MDNNEIFIRKIKPLLPDRINVIETDANINDEECVKLAVDELHKLVAAA